MVCYHLKEADIVFILYDISDAISMFFIIYLGFEKSREWAARLKKEGVKPTVLYLIGNKKDIVTMNPTLRKV